MAYFPGSGIVPFTLIVPDGTSLNTILKTWTCHWYWLFYSMSAGNQLSIGGIQSEGLTTAGAYSNGFFEGIGAVSNGPTSQADSPAISNTDAVEYVYPFRMRLRVFNANIGTTPAGGSIKIRGFYIP